MSIDAQPFTESSVRVVFSDAPSDEVSDRITSFCRSLPRDGIVDVVPAYVTVTVFFDPDVTDHDAVIQRIQDAEDVTIDEELGCETSIIPVLYDGEDLDWMCEHTGFDAPELISRHCAPEYRVCMLGFTPGFPYLSGMDVRLSASRLDSPRMNVPAGSVGIAGEQTGVYPFDSPGGWRLIGRTPLTLFNPAEPEPAVIRPGTRLQFESISHDCFELIRDLIQDGDITPLELVTRTRRIDLNCDAGEGAGTDLELMESVTSVNICCGFHAGNEDLTHETMDAAWSRGLCIGAHPGFADREHFGRRELNVDIAQIYKLMMDQVGPFLTYASSKGIRVNHVKPHGALYNMASRDREIAEVIVRAIQDLDPELALMGLSGSYLIEAGENAGVRVIREAFTDRGYDDNGRLLSRSEPGAVLSNSEAVATRVLSMVQTGGVRSASGKAITIQADSMCLHGDTPGAAEHAKALRAALDGQNINVSGVTP